MIHRLSQHRLRSALLELLRCPSCGGSMEAAGADPGNTEVRCTDCNLGAPVRNGIPRFVDEPADPTARRTQASFGYEWTHFKEWEPSGETNFRDYFEGVDLEALRGRRVLDAGCGMGRHARQIARYAAHVVAVDFSRAIDQAAHNTAPCDNVDCVQGDLLQLPLALEAFDLVYSIGVLHHIGETQRALAGLAARVRPGGRLRVYLYWKRDGWSRWLLAGVTTARRLTTRLPFPLLRALCWVLSVGLFTSVVLPYRAVRWLGVELGDTWPLVVYARYPFVVLYNDQFDRFSAPLEQRFDAREVEALLQSVGLEEVTVRPRFGWVAEGVRPLERGTRRPVAMPGSRDAAHAARPPEASLDRA